MSTPQRLIPIYTTRGDLGAYLAYPNLFNRSGEWIGWVTTDRSVYSVHGQYIGTLNIESTFGARILRKRAYDFNKPDRNPPTPPAPILAPAHAPLAPQMGEISLSMLDVLDEEPELLPTLDFGEMRQDLD